MDNSASYLAKDIAWVAVDGAWSKENTNGICFHGIEYEVQGTQSEPPAEKSPIEKRVSYGIVLFDKKFTEGSIEIEIEFDDVDFRSVAGIILQYNTAEKTFLSFSINGFALDAPKNRFSRSYRLDFFGAPFEHSSSVQPTRSRDVQHIWNTLFDAGGGATIEAKKRYLLRVDVQGSFVTMSLNGVEVGGYNLPVPSLRGLPCGVICIGKGDIHIRDGCVVNKKPKAFIVMQFNTPEYESLYQDVVVPICELEGFQPYRADSTYKPGLIIEDIKNQIMSSAVIIAEITPKNPNVYFEVGYADALKKPLILIADKDQGLKPFDVQAYRTLFYENSIGGKAKIESDLREYLKGIMRTQR